MDRETYKKAVAEVILFDNTDVITTSGGGPGGGSLFSFRRHADQSDRHKYHAPAV